MNQKSLSPSGARLLDIEPPTSSEQDSSASGEHLNLQLTPEDRWTLFEDAPDAMLACDSKGRIVDLNVQCLQMFGYDREELIGAQIETLIPNRFRTAHVDRRKGYVSEPGGQPMIAARDIWGMHKNGSELAVEVGLRAVQSGAHKLIIGIVRDRTERTLAAQQLLKQAEFERTMSALSATFINLSPERVDGEIANGLKILAEILGGDRSSIGFVQANSEEILITHAWTRGGFPEYSKGFLHILMPWLSRRIKMGETVIANAPEDLPAEARLEREFMESQGIKSSLVVPLRVGGRVVGVLSCSSMRDPQRWDAVKISRLQAIAEVFANALMRKQVDEKLQTAYAEIQRLKEQVEQENSYLRQEIKLEYSHKIVVGNSAAMRAVLKKAEQVAGTDSTVLVLGETGTGKELVARTIHEMSGRNRRVMVKTNCAALPGTLIESELFGREKGAYTGALAREIGRFELADQSTIFLDEIGELPPEVQAKLLRVLQEGEFERLGSAKTIKVNVRVIAATSRDLPAMVREGKFRPDLFYRLNVFPIVVPPLRDRLEDIPALVWHILGEFGTRFGRNFDGVQASTMRKFQKYAWPGNVRELRNVIERSLILTTGPIFKAEIPEAEEKPAPKMRRLGEVESEHFHRVLQATDWRIRGKGGAAEILGLKPTTLEARMKKLKIIRPS
ncbi:MAG TPA: sigma 54-interacting transcriptional regulator [Terriglobales bacterium]